MKRWQKSLCWLTALLWVTATCALSGSEAGSGHPAEMETPHCNFTVAESIPSGEPVIVQIVLRNPSTNAIEVLQYHTPFEGILGDIFELRYQGEALSYQGPMVKRRPPEDEDWLPVDAGATLSAEVDISSAWKLSLPGVYSLQLRNDISYRLAEHSDSLKIAAASCGVVRFLIF